MEKRLSLERQPSRIVKTALQAANELIPIVEREKLYVTIKGNKHLYFEAWQLLAAFFGISARVIRTTEVYDKEKLLGFLAYAEAIKDEKVISAAEMECTFDEERGGKKLWQGKPRFQLRSMAQTRACVKALKQCLSWVVVLAGYRPESAEEIAQGELEL